jgi:hypothetical protein
MYLRYKDYKKLIEETNLQDIISQDDTIRTDSELIAQEEITSYLKQKYNTDSEFQDTTVYDNAATYKANNLVEINAMLVWDKTVTYGIDSLVIYTGHIYWALVGTNLNLQPDINPTKWKDLGLQYSLYYTLFPQPAFDYYKLYSIGDKVFWSDKTYTCKIESVTIYPDDPINGTVYWGIGTAYTVTVGTLGNSTYWIKGDNRSAKIVAAMVEVSLYSMLKRIAPNNVPDIRVKAYDDAIQWLKDCASGEVTPNLPLIAEYRKGQRIRYGSRQQKNQNDY